MLTYVLHLLLLFLPKVEWTRNQGRLMLATCFVTLSSLVFRGTCCTAEGTSFTQDVHWATCQKLPGASCTLHTAIVTQSAQRKKQRLREVNEVA